LGESVFVFLLGRAGEGNEVLDEEVGAVSKWEHDEDFGACVALITEFPTGISKIFIQKVCKIWKDNKQQS
jgi:hypothetical protein